MTTAYVDYTYYTNTYLGTAIASTDFARLALRASAVIDQVTFNRAASDTENTNAIKDATCAVAEELQRELADGGSDAVQSESIGNYSVTYSIGASKIMTMQQKREEAARLYLGNTGLMFKGFACGEYGHGD